MFSTLVHDKTCKTNDIPISLHCTYTQKSSFLTMHIKLLQDREVQKQTRQLKIIMFQ